MEALDVVLTEPGLTDRRAELQGTLLLAHPAWMTYRGLCSISRSAALKVLYPQRHEFFHRALNAFRYVNDAAFRKVLYAELKSEAFVPSLMEAGAPRLVGNILQQMVELGIRGVGQDTFERGRAMLGGFAEQLQRALDSGAVAEAEPFKPAKRRELMAAVRTWNGLPKVGVPQGAPRLKTAGLLQQERLQRKQEMLAWLKEVGVRSDQVASGVAEQLQQPEAMTRYADAFGTKLTLSALRQSLALSPDAYAELHRQWCEVEEAKRLERQAETVSRLKQAARQRAWNAALMSAQDMMAAYGITKAEYELWSGDGRLPYSVPIDDIQPKTQGLHHPEHLRHVTQELLDEWRAKDWASLTPQARTARRRSAEGAKALMLLRQGLATLVQEHRCEPVRPADDGDFLQQAELVFARTETVDVPVAAVGDDVVWSLPVELHAKVKRPKTRAEVEALSSALGTAFDTTARQHATDALRRFIADTAQQYREVLADLQLQNLLKAVRGLLSKGVTQENLGQPDTLHRRIAGPLRSLLERAASEQAQALLNLQDYPRAFTLARSLNRVVHFTFGPTNSGKTHRALAAMQAARSGVYLAPLRLLAMEVRDKLKAAGILCNLLTGEEHELVPGAQHTACTVEMLDPTREVDVAVIDEIQMLEDRERGWAWTAALVGVPAREVYVCGSDRVESPCVRAVEALDEQYTVQRLRRMTPLEVEQDTVAAQPVKAGARRSLQKGDAVIAFSRRDVLTLSARIRQWGFNVATIYGALAPEVRRTESERFATGRADVVVATDAIGMGLNLPIRRVVFASASKFDGERVRALNAIEVQQIAGRAGRFGLYDEGRVTAFEANDLCHVRKQLDELKATRLERLPIAPSFWHIQTLSEVLRTQDVGRLLSFFVTRIAVESPLFTTAQLQDSVRLAELVESTASTLSLAEKYAFSTAPVTPDKPEEAGYFVDCLRRFAKGLPVPMETAPVWLGSQDAKHLEAAETLTKHLSLYAWLSFKFPERFHEGDRVASFRSALSRYIEQALLTQNGFGLTSREMFNDRRSSWF